jgi:hypothetical protein
MPLADFQQSFRGLTMGPGLDVGLLSMNGLEDLTIRLGDTPQAFEDGDIEGAAYLNAKEVILEVAVAGAKKDPGHGDLLASVLQVFSRTADSFPFHFKEPGRPERYINLRVLDRVIPRNAQNAAGFQVVTVRLKAADPKIYGTVEKSVNLTPFSTTAAAIDYSLDYPKDFPAPSGTEKVATNEGYSESYPLIRFFGPTSGTVDGVRLLNTTTGQTMEILAPILVGQTLSADMGRFKRGLATGTPYISLDGANRYGLWTPPREAFYLAPGDNLLRYEVDGSSTDALCVVTFRDTDI